MLLCRNGNFLGFSGFLNAVGRDGGAVDIDAARHTRAIEVCEVPVDGERSEHVALALLRRGPHEPSHEVENL